MQAGDRSADPFAYALNTCKNGDVKPILPLLDFSFDDSGQLDVKFHFHVFTYPAPGSPMRLVFPQLKKNGWPVSGPYCYNGALTGWTLDFDFDSTVGNKVSPRSPPSRPSLRCATFH